MIFIFVVLPLVDAMNIYLYFFIDSGFDLQVLRSIVLAFFLDDSVVVP